MTDIESSYSAHANAYVTKPTDWADYERVVIQIHNFYGHIATLPRHKPDLASFPGQGERSV